MNNFAIKNVDKLVNACRHNDLKLVYEYLHKVPSLNTCNSTEHKMSPLGAAALFYNESIVKVLLDQGADPDYPAYYGLPILHALIDAGGWSYEEVYCFNNASEKEDLMKNMKMIKFLVEYGNANINLISSKNTKFAKGKSPLGVAKISHGLAYKYLLSLGAELIEDKN